MPDEFLFPKRCIADCMKLNRYLYFSKLNKILKLNHGKSSYFQLILMVSNFSFVFYTNNFKLNLKEIELYME